MYFNVISSGSKGNATVVVNNKTVILIDMGISLTRLTEGLKEIGFEVKDITAAIFTHNHSDHINGLRFISPKIQYALETTIPGTYNIVNLYEPFEIGDIKITPFRTSHDATNPCGYVLESGDEKLVYMTDTGVVLEEVMPIVKNPTYLIIESNHDIKMLLATNRTYQLKSRIMSDHGHLCNEDSAIATCSIIGDKTKEIVLAHLSEEANTPELALAAYLKVFRHFGINVDNYKLRCANQWTSLIGGNYENQNPLHW